VDEAGRPVCDSVVGERHRFGLAAQHMTHARSVAACRREVALPGLRIRSRQTLSGATGLPTSRLWHRNSQYPFCHGRPALRVWRCSLHRTHRAGRTAQSQIRAPRRRSAHPDASGLRPVVRSCVMHIWQTEPILAMFEECGSDWTACVERG
jgi:hypothetical protein